MQAIPNKNDERNNKNDKRSIISCERLIKPWQVLPFPGKIAFHIAAIGLYITYEVVVNISNDVHYGWKMYVPFYVSFFTLFYFFAHVCYPLLYENRKSKLLVFIVLIFCFGLSVITILTINHILRYILTGELSVRTHPKTLINAIWRTVTLMIFSGTYWLFLELMRQKNNEISIIKKQQETEREVFHVKIAYENAKINPHFLFNTLQFIHKEIEGNAPKAEEAISGLAEIMRYHLAPLSPDGKVSLTKELEATDIFISMAAQRFGNSFKMRYLKLLDADILDVRVLPHSILTIAENMIKHGKLNNENNPAELTITCHENVLTVNAYNSKPVVENRKGSGLGLENLTLRLEYYYPAQYEMQIRNENDHYDLKLSINL